MLYLLISLSSDRILALEWNLIWPPCALPRPFSELYLSFKIVDMVIRMETKYHTYQRRTFWKHKAIIGRSWNWPIEDERCPLRAGFRIHIVYFLRQQVKKKHNLCSVLINIGFASWTNSFGDAWMYERPSCPWLKAKKATRYSQSSQNQTSCKEPMEWDAIQFYCAYTALHNYYLDFNERGDVQGVFSVYVLFYIAQLILQDQDVPLLTFCTTTLKGFSRQSRKKILPQSHFIQVLWMALLHKAAVIICSLNIYFLL